MAALGHRRAQPTAERYGEKEPGA